ncbi:taste receptor type 2 member 103-like [Acomys russatus]|uniref:taste receptor type 2 member 103-like n=1 Tax=Acomys russatus TaxID=60746 RepID=UPI0021E29116|nr:taste receptor type 2 member 103-like [Acomys russatus]
MLETLKGILTIILITIVNVEFIIGILGNAFMAVVNIIDWLKSGKISAVDKIHIALAFSRTVHMLLLILSFSIVLFRQDSLQMKIAIRMHSNSWTVTNHFNVWFATCLSIFYFLKIANFSNSTFLALKRNVNKVVSVTLVVSLIILLINIIFINIIVDSLEESILQRSSSNNTVKVQSLLLLNTMFTLIPFAASLTMLLLLVLSLWRHLKNMNHSATGSRDVSTVAHIKSLKTVFTFLLLYTVFVMSFLLQSLAFSSKHRNIIILFLWSIETAFPSGHSCALILGNSKLRQAFLSVLWWVRRKCKCTENWAP